MHCSLEEKASRKHAEVSEKQLSFKLLIYFSLFFCYGP